MLKEEKFDPTNTVFIEGYLKENTLKLDDSDPKNKSIKGALVIATDELNSYKMQFSVSETKRDGSHSEAYDNLLELFPSKTQSIASFLEVTPKATWEVASNASSKIWMVGSMEEYTRMKKGKEAYAVTYKGTRAGFKNATDLRPFDPRANFEIDVYIQEKEFETDAKGEKTGRLLITGLLGDYRGKMHKITLVAEKTVAQAVDQRYQVTQTARFKGILKNAQVQVAVDDSASEPDEDSWGSCAEPEYKTVFIRERVITGGKKAVDQGEKMSYSEEDVKTGLAKREEDIHKNSEERKVKEVGGPANNKGPKKATKGAAAAADAFDDFSNVSVDTEDDF